ncbi:acyl-CoA dehydrogenase [Halieaceae bacterium IMCC14734]|uniref:Acyl-CoA dehydrogenase n=1 Tax=Candidatus Litorirhabdus singularis TaxID=2518993 RepID=A0ABT3TFM7_9GAMM|nr:acyl-CoA dehydrogenase family protein [Candidatus Litorirhabdus singularis]MCX2981117.1 acyl-CoA dehydrogenase [Candidatus Litorirhabdus singularis]
MSEVSEQELGEFRAEVSAWMKDNKPADPGFLLPQTFMEVGSEQVLEFLREWQHKIWSAGYLGMAWPKEYGGQAVAPIYQRIADQEMKRHAVPICFNVIGLSWTGPLINDIGTEAEKQKYLKGILNAEDVWCQGFSEPDHGSDLGNAQCRAVRDGDDYVVNGTKIWTTMGNYAKYMILLARTSTQGARKYDGLSFFLAPMDVAGIDPRPIQKMTGEYGFCETFFTDARIPADCIMGEEGQGWRIAMQTLQYERGAEAGAAGGLMVVRTVMEDLIKDLRGLKRDGEPLLKDPLVRDRLVQLLMEEKAISLGERRQAHSALNTDYPFSLALSGKLRSSEFAREMRQYAVALQGAQGSLYVGDDDAISGGFWQRAYFNNFATTIGGGTSQVQANIIGERVLGLPKD